MNSMPRSEQSAAGRMIDFFRSADLPPAALVLGLCQDEVRARRQKSAAAKARAQATGPSPVAVAAPAATPKVARIKKAKGKKRGPKARTAPTPPAETPLPLEEGVDQEAEDLVVT